MSPSKVVGSSIFLIALCAARDFLQAAPVTLHFEAIVGPPRQGVEGTIPPSWSISLQEGDTVSGTFTFEPFDAASSVAKTTLVQPFEFRIQIKTRSLTTSQYEIEVFNDFTSDEAPEPKDNINTGCSFLGGPVVCKPGSTAPGETIEWAFGVAMFGDPTILDGADVPADPLAWRRFTFYDMGVSFFDVNTHRFYGFLATPQEFQLVPEPAAHLAGGLAIFMLILQRFCVFRRSRHNRWIKCLLAG
jgi:hypothetical protein